MTKFNTTMNLLKSILGSFILILLASFSVIGQGFTPVPAQNKPIAVTNATIHVGDGTIIEKGIVYFEKGKITAVEEGGAENVDINKFKLIDAEGKHLYPGFILPYSSLGLNEVSAVKASRDDRERGRFNPNVRSIIAYNTDSDVIGTLRYNGILLAQVSALGGGVVGTSSIVQLDAWNWEDAIYKEDDALMIDWPSRFYGPRWWLGETEMRVNKNYDSQVMQISKAVADAKAYAESTPEKQNLKLEALTGLFDGSKSLVVYPNGDPKNVVASIQSMKKQGVQRIVIVGGSELLLVKEFLKENNISVILNDVHSLPSNADEDVDMPYKLPFLLKQAGIKFCFGYFSSLANSRNLAFYAGTASAYGLTKEEALQAITKDAAEILGIGDKTGMIKIGLDANIIISDGDALDMKSNKLSHAFIQGRQIQLTNKQVQLYEKYKKKYDQGK